MSHEMISRVSVFLSLDIPHYSSVLAFPYMPFESRLLSFPSYIVKPANNQIKCSLLNKQNKQTNKKRQPHIIQVNKAQERPFGCRSSFHGQGSIYHNIGFYIVFFSFPFCKIF
jgi:DNA-directed RNA polymerase subunit E'/Rpb7